MREFLTLIAVLALATAAQAAIIQTVELTGTAGGTMYVDIHSLGTFTTSMGYSADEYDVYFRSDGTATGKFAAFDAAITGDLYQQWGAYGGIPTPNGAVSSLPLADRHADTHIVLTEAKLANVAPAEDNDQSYGIRDSGTYHVAHGVGTYLAAQVGVLGDWQVDNLHFVHVAVLHGTPISFGGGTYQIGVDEFDEPIYADFAGKVADAGGEIFSVDGIVVVPEPATLGLLLLGGLGIIARRRR